MTHLKNVMLTGLITTAITLSNCSKDDVPHAENEEELIDKVTLTFTPTGEGTAIIITATDPDGNGARSLTPGSAISLAANTTYTLALTLENTAQNENITQEIKEEDDKHLFFFSFTANIFSDPSGDGNVDNRADAINYNDMDENNLPVGLSTNWTTGNASTGGTFKVLLKHQPDIKSATSTSTVGESDIDISWKININ